ncbi:MAG: hypothetical protein KF745_06445 [Phycisphaeraceae bacterium]|nr:hypothetical protein [Phycisphaeraceae bacterium]
MNLWSHLGIGRVTPALDDRAREIHVAPEGEIREAFREAGVSPDDLRARLRAADLSSPKLLVAVVLGIVLVQLLDTFWRDGGYLVAVLLVVVIAGMQGVQWSSRRVGAQQARTIAAEGLCGQCAYRIDGLATASDGMLVCSECGAAWLAERVTHSIFDPERRTGSSGSDAGRSGTKGALFTDDAGRLVFLATRGLSAFNAPLRAEIGGWEIARLRDRVRQYGKTTRQWVGLGAAGVGVVAAGTWVAGVATGRMEFTTVALAFIIALVAAGVWLGSVLGRWFITPADFREALLGEGRCPVCVATLPGGGGGGREVCKRCGSTWETGVAGCGGKG